MPKAVHDRANLLQRKNPSMKESTAWAVATQQMKAKGKFHPEKKKEASALDKLAQALVVVEDHSEEYLADLEKTALNKAERILLSPELKSALKAYTEQFSKMPGSTGPTDNAVRQTLRDLRTAAGGGSHDTIARFGPHLRRVPDNLPKGMDTVLKRTGALNANREITLQPSIAHRRIEDMGKYPGSGLYSYLAAIKKVVDEETRRAKMPVPPGFW
jgi:hypothetical protein